jgi:hypothetical protein
MSVPSPAEQENAEQPVMFPPLTFHSRTGHWSLFDKVRFRWGGGGDIVLGIAMIGGGHSAATAVLGVLFIALGIVTWVLTGFGTKGAEPPHDWYAAWNLMSPARRAVAGTGAVIGMAFWYLFFFWFFILKMVWRYIIAPSM